MFVQLNTQYMRSSAVLLTLLSLLSAIPCRAQQYFCMEEGTELVYIRRYADNGNVKWKHTMSIRKISASPVNGTEVGYSSYFEDRKGESITKDTVMLVAEITEKGDVTIDISASMVAVIKGFLWKNAKVEAAGGKTVLPANLSVGDTLPEAHGSVSALGMTMNVDVTERKVIGKEILTTPAGTFDCIVISEHKTEKGMMRNRITTAHTWYAKGTGMVRHDTYDRNMKLETSEILERIIKK